MKPDLPPTTWDFLGDVAAAWGLDWARKLRDEIAVGSLIDLGSAVSGCTTTEDRPAPYLRQSAKSEIRQLRLGDHLSAKPTAQPQLETRRSTLDLAREINHAARKEVA